MDTLPQLNTWKGLIALVIFLIALFWFLKITIFALKKIAKQNITNKKIIAAITKTLVVFKPIATAIILLDFIAINYINHPIIILVVGIFGYAQLKNYMNGVFLKLNPLMRKGALVNIAEFSGLIKEMRPLGLIISTENGERFVNYTTIETSGFAVKSNDTSLLRQTLYLQTDKTQNQVLDVLFDNPILNYEENPTLKATESSLLKLQYTLETGTTTATLIAFLETQNIKATKTNNIIS